MEEYYNSSLALWGLKCEESATTGVNFLEVFDIKDDIAAVRFKNGNCGIVDSKGKLLMRLPKYNQVEFAENDFLKIVSKQNFLIDMRSKAFFPACRNQRRLESLNCCTLEDSYTPDPRRYMRYASIRLYHYQKLLVIKSKNFISFIFRCLPITLFNSAYDDF